MNGKDIFLKTLDFEQTDRPLRWETPGIWGITKKRWIEEGFDLTGDKKTFFDYFNMDNPIWLPFKGGWTGNPYYPMFDKKTIKDDGINVIHLDKDGILKKERKKNPETSMPQFLKFPVENKKDYETKIKFRMDFSSEKRFHANWKQLVESYKHRIKPLGMFIIGPFGYLRNLFGDEQLMYMLFDEKQLIHQILNDWKDYYLGFLDKVCNDIIPDFVMIWEDICYNMGPLISPDNYKEFMSPYLKQVIKKVKQKNIKGILVDTDGNLHSLIPIYLECGVNGFFPFEVQAGMDIVKLRKQYKKDFVILGGLDKNKLAIDKQAIMEEVDKKVPFMLSQKGYIPMLDHTVPPNVSFENFKFFIDYIRKVKY